MSVQNLEAEFRIFMKVQKEAIEAINANDGETIHYAMLEIELMGETTTWPRLRKAVADFLRLRAEHIPTREARDARDLESIRKDVEEAIEEAKGSLTAYNAMALRSNLGSAEDIWERTDVRTIREDAAAFLRKYAAYAEFERFTA